MRENGFQTRDFREEGRALICEIFFLLQNFSGAFLLLFSSRIRSSICPFEAKVNWSGSACSIRSVPSPAQSQGGSPSLFRALGSESGLNTKLCFLLRRYFYKLHPWPFSLRSRHFWCPYSITVLFPNKQQELCWSLL
ncbi:uncharacterized protein LOC18448269 isoform X2 [Amborella trichopoda]|uniref:uncharacterized protein LOC18448269 isoform X2 n=1 Tax=Amborella trichopoda TaxID=13333 RepID=UPI0009BE42FC|nr:uncharacterized protein LOC18448269 isoform X2 [Amborella trichopoda]|eukprot:XP_020531763.1 uncharacterized protein LOC18448269 isoform X2 [Amborella trichopoda]